MMKPHYRRELHNSPEYRALTKDGWEPLAINDSNQVLLTKTYDDSKDASHGQSHTRQVRQSHAK